MRRDGPDLPEHDVHVWISGYLDGELEPRERRAFEERLKNDPELARQFEQIQEVTGMTSRMRLKEFPDRVWDRYWEGAYNRLERRIGWVLLSLGAVVLLATGLYHLGASLLEEAAGPWWLRSAIAAVAGGVAILAVSVVRERLALWRRDPYREVKR